MSELTVERHRVGTAWDLGALMAPGTATSAPQPVRATSGWVAEGDLERADLYIDSGPTGRSIFWPDWFAVLHPAYSTTDAVLNLVDSVWFDRPDDPVQFLLVVKDPPLPALSETVAELRSILDLPATEVAAMCGVNRRQLYNFLEGRPTSASREQWIRKLHALVSNLNHAAGEDRARLRAALLLPVDGQRSFLDAARARDIDALEPIADELEARLQAGFEGRIRRPLPTRADGSRRDGVSDFLSVHGE